MSDYATNAKFSHGMENPMVLSDMQTLLALHDLRKQVFAKCDNDALAALSLIVKLKASIEVDIEWRLSVTTTLDPETLTDAEVEDWIDCVFMTRS